MIILEAYSSFCSFIPCFLKTGERARYARGEPILLGEVSAMPRSKRERRERTHDWQQIQQYTLWPEQQLYEKIRPVVLFGETAASRAKEIGASERTLHHQADQFDQHGMASLFPKKSTPSPDKGRSLPPDMRQLIVDLKTEYPSFRSHEIARICFLRDAAQVLGPYCSTSLG
jgi:hypothetical protein